MFDELKRCMRRQLEVRVQAVTSTDRFNIQFRTAGMDKTKERLGQREDGRGSASNYAADSYRKGMWNPKPRRALFLVLPEVTVIYSTQLHFSASISHKRCVSRFRRVYYITSQTHAPRL